MELFFNRVGTLVENSLSLVCSNAWRAGEAHGVFLGAVLQLKGWTGG